VLRQLLTESVALALLGAAVGVALAVGGVRMFTHSSLATLPRIHDVTIDGRVLAFTLVVSVASGLLFGLLPAIHAGRVRLTSDLIAGKRESSRGASRRVNNTLVVTQLSLSLVLLIAAGLVLKSFQRLTQVDFGFHPDGVTSIALPRRRPTGQQRRHVRRGDEEDERHGGEKNGQRARARTGERLVQRLDDRLHPCLARIDRRMGNVLLARPIPHDLRRLRLGVLRGDAWLEAPDTRVEEAKTPERIQSHRHVRGDIRPRKGEVRRHHADDLVRLSVDVDRLTHDGRIAAEAGMPQAVAEDHDGVLAR